MNAIILADRFEVPLRNQVGITASGETEAVSSHLNTWQYLKPANRGPPQFTLVSGHFTVALV